MASGAHLFRASFLVPGLALALAGCSGPSDEGTVGAELAASAAMPSNADYFVVTRPDPRRCEAPLCGGWYVKHVNEPKTVCADGTLEAECYVASIGLEAIGLSRQEELDLRAAVESGKAIFKARVMTSEFFGTTIGALESIEAWTGVTGTPAEGTFFRAADNGIRCIHAPCPSTTAHRLNGSDATPVIDVELGTRAGVHPAALERVENALDTREGILVAGAITSAPCGGSSCAVVTATEIYLRAGR